MLSEKVFCFFFTCITLFDIIETVPFRNYMKLGELAWDFCPIVN